ncbi:zinc ribbon domain-containing protein [Lactococcus garvieae]|uniref:Zinc-ribbon domain-containing protein n=1 Tax=Lactococcus garvieae TaxID=1363 RepID=A0A1I4GHA9_9LACT|nr:zinc ribbon domain-containing protein [Lactococcus garvieae]SFL29249.1 zinc-ribbon domain-containing protein [Lactococcus garvieae]
MEEEEFCYHCGKPIFEDKANFCPYCGAKTTRAKIAASTAELNRLSKERAEQGYSNRTTDEIETSIKNESLSNNDGSLNIKPRKAYFLLPYLWMAATYLAVYFTQHSGQLENIKRWSDLFLPTNSMVLLTFVFGVGYFLMYVFALPTSIKMTNLFVMPAFKILLYIPLFGWAFWFGIWVIVWATINQFACPAFFGDFVWSKKYKSSSLRKVMSDAKREFRNSQK